MPFTWAKLMLWVCDWHQVSHSRRTKQRTAVLSSSLFPKGRIMSKSRHEIQKHNHELLATLAERVGEIVDHQPGTCPSTIVSFLKTQMLPHAIGEERHFYPALETLVKEHGQATATMRIDHEYIEGYIDWIEETVQELETADDEEK